MMHAGHPSHDVFFSQTLAAFPSIAAVAAVATWTLGLLWHALMRMIGTASLATYAGGGVLLAALIILVVDLLSAGDRTPLVDLVDECQVVVGRVSQGADCCSDPRSRLRRARRRDAVGRVERSAQSADIEE